MLAEVHKEEEKRNEEVKKMNLNKQQPGSENVNTNNNSQKKRPMIEELN